MHRRSLRGPRSPSRVAARYGDGLWPPLIAVVRGPSGKRRTAAKATTGGLTASDDTRCSDDVLLRRSRRRASLRLAVIEKCREIRQVQYWRRAKMS